MIITDFHQKCNAYSEKKTYCMDGWRIGITAYKEVKTRLIVVQKTTMKFCLNCQRNRSPSKWSKMDSLVNIYRPIPLSNTFLLRYHMESVTLKIMNICERTCASYTIAASEWVHMATSIVIGTSKKLMDCVRDFQQYCSTNELHITHTH